MRVFVAWHKHTSLTGSRAGTHTHTHTRSALSLSHTQKISAICAWRGAIAYFFGWSFALAIATSPRHTALLHTSSSSSQVGDFAARRTTILCVWCSIVAVAQLSSLDLNQYHCESAVSQCVQSDLSGRRFRRFVRGVCSKCLGVFIKY